MAEKLPMNQRKSRLSLACIEAVSSQAGYQVVEIKVDEDSVDATFYGDFGLKPRIDFQAKATARDLVKSDGQIHYPLPKKNYDDLRVESITPRILIIMLMPDDPDDWIEQTDEALCVRHGVYWQSILGAPDSANTDSVTVYVPIANMLDSEQLLRMMRKAERREAI